MACRKEFSNWKKTHGFKHIRNFELGILQKKVPWILSKHINCYYDSKAMGIFNHCMSEKRYFAKSKAMIVQKFRFGAMLFVMLFVFKALIFITYVVIMCAIFLVSIYPICAIPKM